MTTIDLNRITAKSYKKLTLALITNLLQEDKDNPDPEIQQIYKNLLNLRYDEILEIAGSLAFSVQIEINKNIINSHFRIKLLQRNLIKFGASISQMKRWFGMQANEITALKKACGVEPTPGRAAFITKEEDIHKIYKCYKELDNVVSDSHPYRDAEIYFLLAKRFNVSIKSLEASLNLY